jgi:hypothetical protein
VKPGGLDMVRAFAGTMLGEVHCRPVPIVMLHSREADLQFWLV